MSVVKVISIDYQDIDIGIIFIDLCIVDWHLKKTDLVYCSHGWAPSTENALHLWKIVGFTIPPIDHVIAFINILRVMLEQYLIEIALSWADEGSMSLHRDLHP